MYPRLVTCAHVRNCTCVRVCLRVGTCVGADAYRQARARACVRACMRPCVCACMWTHVCGRVRMRSWAPSAFGSSSSSSSLGPSSPNGSYAAAPNLLESLSICASTRARACVRECLCVCACVCRAGVCGSVRGCRCRAGWNGKWSTGQWHSCTRRHRARHFPSAAPRGLHHYKHAQPSDEGNSSYAACMTRIAYRRAPPQSCEMARRTGGQ
jgi:hypothetical protein